MSRGSESPVQVRPAQVDRRWAVLALLVVLVLVAAGVGAATLLPGAAPPSASPGGSAGTESAYAQLFAQVGPNGEVTKQIALEAFSLAIAPLPGVTPPAGAAPQPWEQADGTFAVEWLQPYLDQLTPDQKAAVDAALAQPANTPIISDSGAYSPRIVLADASDYTTDATILADDKAAELTRAGASATGLKFDYSLSINAVQVAKEEALAYTNNGIELFPDGTKKPYCEVHVNPLLVTLSQAHPEFTQASLAHEMWHCIQNAYLGGAQKKVPGWILEGQSEWAGEMLNAPTAIGASWWQDYLQTPAKSLYSRTYDGVGFYLHLVEKQINPWPLLLPMLTAANNDAAFTGTGANADSYLDSWSSGLFRDQSLGADWYATGFSDALIAQANSLWPPKNPNPKTRQDLYIANNDAKQVSAATVSNTLYNLVASADLVGIKIDGHARLHAGARDDIGLAQRLYCTHPDGCTCPPGQTWIGPTSVEYMPPNTPNQLGLTGGLKGAKGVVVGISLKDLCVPLGSCKTDCGHSNGDPHLRTINRYRYDFQAAGEFTLLRNADSSIEIQARQEPYTGSLTTFHAVSINTAIAVHTGGHKLALYATANGPVIRVDGSVVDPANLPALGNGSAIKSVSGGYRLDLADGTIVWALGLGEWGVNAIVQPSADLVASGTGLLGPITPGGMGVPALPDGTQLPAAPDSETRHTILYGQFADAWRVTDATTLFDYDPGKSTATYTDRNFPSDADDAALTAALASPDPTRQSTADSACTGISDQDLQAECVFDVYATDDTGFAQGYQAEQDLYDSGIATPTPSPTRAPVTGAQQVIELQDLVGATVGPDDTLYVAMDTAEGANQLLAIDPTSGAVKHQVQMGVATRLYFAAGSVWAAGQTTDSNGQHCSVTRYDAQTLATVGDYPIPCTGFEGAPRLTSMGDAIWFVDTTRTDPSTGNGTLLTRIDPSTNAPGASVPLPGPDGCCQASQGAIFCYCGQSDEWRLTASDSAFVDLGNYQQIYPAGTGFWAEQGQTALYVDAPGAPSITIPFTDPQLEDRIVGGDPTGVYVQGEPPDTPLSRVAADGAPVTLANAPTYGSGVDETQLDYLSGAFPSFATPRGYVHLWMFKETPDSAMALWLQWAPLP